MTKRIISCVLSACLIMGIFTQEVYAAGGATDSDSITDIVIADTNTIDEAVAIAEGSTRTVDDIIAQSKFSWNTGHGFAAERGNNLIDSVKGNNAEVVGDNNIANGADRKITSRGGNTIYIQTKYHSTASASIYACFENGKYRYLYPNGKPMQVEVPKEQYDEAVALMKKRIIENQVPGVTNPDEAENLVRPGNLTYKQAMNLAKPGTIESLSYDATNGCVAAVGAFGIGTLLNYAVLRINGVDRKEAVKTSAIEGVRTGAGVFATSVIAGQLAKTGVMNVFKPSTEALTKALGEDFSKALLKAFGQKVIAQEGESVAVTATKQAAELLRSEVLVAVVTLVVFSVPDAVNMFRGRISKKQFVKNFAVSAITIVAGVAGYGVGGLVSNLVVPGVGTVPGAIVGSLLFGTGGAFVADKIADYITDDDADEMYAIFEERFKQDCEDYLITEDEANNILAELDGKLTDNAFKDMYQSKDREQYVDDMLDPLFEAEVKKRPRIEAPTEEEMRYILKEELDGVVFVH